MAATISIALTCARSFSSPRTSRSPASSPCSAQSNWPTPSSATARPPTTFIIYGDQSDASSVIFYTHDFLRKPALSVFERMLAAWRRFVAAVGLLLSRRAQDLPQRRSAFKAMGHGERKWLFAQDTNQSKAEQLLAGRLYPVQSIADKALWTDRPLPR